jgi:hypothetical protein
LIIQVIYFEAIVFGGEDCIELFDENEKSAPVFFYRDEGAELLNANAVRFVHRETGSQLKHLPRESVCSTPNNVGTVPEWIKYGKSGVPRGGKSW